MVLRKINAVISIVITVLLLDHAIFHAVWMLAQGAIQKTQNPLSKILFCLMLVHAAMCITMAIRGNKGAEKRKCNEYANKNAATMIQRVGGMLLIVFTVLHIAGAIGIMQPPPFVHAVLPPLFFAMALLHVAISFSKALITLGIGNAKAVKIVDVAVKVICALTLIAAIVGFYLYL